MSAPGVTEGHISRQSASYRQGLVLGLTMAEVMILLVFCLLIALAAFLKVEHDKRLKAEADLRQEKEAAIVNRDFVDSFKNNPQLKQLLERQPLASNQGKIEDYWRELVEGSSIIAAARQNGLTSGDLRERMGDIKALKEKGLDLKKIERDALITASVDKVIMPAGTATPERVTQLIAKGLLERAPPQKVASEGHKWPPIIALNDANGRFFKSGSAEVDAAFRQQLVDGPQSTAAHIARLMKEYDVDVIEVVGHTDEQPVGNRQSNLDSDLVPALNNSINITAVRPSDNAGLGLARAVSVVGILRQSKELGSYKILPLSGGQLINTDETLALGGNPGDVRERRRIEIRLRKTSPRVIEQRQAQTIIPKTTAPAAAVTSPPNTTPMPPARPASSSWAPPSGSSPIQLFPPSIFIQPVR
ncbi:hypothetical protein [Pseudolabrys sp.]|uniref:hypothetical protein n=1 Tax=Pseudolabrys sp. TaxID=1960880 RepID=UPI003D0E512A